MKEEVENPEVELEEEKVEDNFDDVKLPSEAKTKYANNFETVDELKKGIVNLKADVPEYMLNGMSEEALEQYYVDLRKEFSSKPKEEVETKEEVTSDNPSDVISDDLWSELDKTFNETGSITDEQIKKLEELGIPKKVQENYIKGLEAEKNDFNNKLYDMAGGKEQFDTIKEWAENKYSQEELDRYTSGTYDEVIIKLEGLKARYLAENNGEINTDRIHGSAKVQSGNAYATQQEYAIDRMSREYKTNPRFKAKVDMKFKNSSFGY